MGVRSFVVREVASMQVIEQGIPFHTKRERPVPLLTVIVISPWRFYMVRCDKFQSGNSQVDGGVRMTGWVYIQTLPVSKSISDALI